MPDTCRQYVRTRAILRFLAISIALAVFAGWGPGQSATAAPPVKRVMLLQPTSLAYPFYADFTNSFKQRIQEEPSINVEYLHEYSDLFKYTSDDAVIRSIAEVFRQKYKNNRPDIIVAHSVYGLKFLDMYCKDVFGGIPVIAYYTRPVYVDHSATPDNYTYCYPEIDPAKNVELILGMKPAIKELYVVMGQSEDERRVREELPQQLAVFSDRLTVTHLNDLSMPRLLEKTRTIKGDAAILFVDHMADADGNFFIPAQVIRSIAAEAQVPVFGSYSTHLGGSGGVGGYILKMNDFGRKVGDLAVPILLGTAGPGGVKTVNISEYRFDWPEMERWGFDEAKLPPGSIIVNKPPSLWQLYKWQIAAAGSLAVALVAVLAALLMRHQRKLRDSEKAAQLREEMLAERDETIEHRTAELQRQKQLELIAQKSLYALSIRQVSQQNLEEILDEVLDIAVNLSGADMGNIQLYDGKDNSLKIAVQQGFGGEFLKFFSSVHDERGASCAAALKHRQRTVVEDVTQSPFFVGTPALDVMLAAGARACQSTPLVARTGRLVGLLNTHYRQTIREGELELGFIDLLACQAADIIETYQALQQREAELFRIDRLNTVGEMAAAIGHEVRNPMTTVRGYLQMMQRKQEYAGQSEQFKIMIEELDRANIIISDFLSLAKNKVVEMRISNLNDVISALLPLLQAEALRTNHELSIDMDDIPDFQMDEKEIRQMILNLTNNAFQAMEPGGKVTIATRATKDRVILSVRDTGKGIPQEILAQIGKPFLSTKENGTGLGLPVCYRIAERHGASIDAKTSPQGTIFSVYFRIHH